MISHPWPTMNALQGFIVLSDFTPSRIKKYPLNYDSGESNKLYFSCHLAQYLHH